MKLSPTMRPHSHAVALFSVMLGLLAACGDAAPPAAPLPSPPSTATATPTPRAFERAAIELPRDDGPHAAQTEWWYYNGHVNAPGEETYSFHLVVFKRQGSGTGPAARSAYVGHIGITDHTRRTFSYEQAVLLPPQQELTPGRFDVAAGSISARGGNGVDEIAGIAGEYGLRLALQTAKPPVIHGDAGIVGVSPEELSYYYSRTRMTATGELTVAGRAVPVQGSAWMDHQWGDFSLTGAAGWDWFALQLDDDSELMVSVLRDAEGRVSTQYGTWVAPDGAATGITGDELQVQALGEWTSPLTGTTYPMGWRLQLPGNGLAVELAPVIPEQEMDTTATTGKVYWEGAARVTGTLGAKPVAGYGYIELTGYKERTAQ